MALQNGALERKWTLFKHILLHHIFHQHFYFFVSFIYVVNVTCIFPLRFVWKIGFMIGLGFVLSVLYHFLRNRLTKRQTFTLCTTKKMAVVSSREFCIIFSICISTFSSWTYVGNEMRSSRLGTEAIPLLFTFMFWCLQLHGPFWTQRCVRASRCQYLPQTDTFIFPSLRFFLPVIRSEG